MGDDNPVLALPSAAGVQEGDSAVQIDLSQEEFELMLLMLGYALGARSRDGGIPKSWWKLMDALVDALNQGNPNWIPDEIPKESVP
jgi:hypothetical protein